MCSPKPAPSSPKTTGGPAAAEAVPSAPGAPSDGSHRPPTERVDGLPAEWTPEMRRIMNRITVAGCLAMVYFEFTSSTPRVDLLVKLGTSYRQFGILEAIPPLMLFGQFVAGLLVNRLRHRKGPWMALTIAARSMAIPFAILPWIMPDPPYETLIWCLIGTLAVSECCANLGVPMWFSWMGDLLPHRTLGEYWARRRRWLALSSVASLIFSALFFEVFKDVDIRATFLVVATIGAVAGVWDILLFLKVSEPQVEHSERPDWHRLAQPFRDPDFRPFIIFWAYWSFAATFSFPFFRLFMLRYLGMSVPAIQLLYCCNAAGGAILTARIGRLSDRMGHRPVMVLCTALKSLVVIGMFVAQPGWALLILGPIFVFDNMLNTGLFVAQSGYMLKYSPRANRSMYVAAVLATSGLAGAAASMLSGQFLQAVGDRTWTVWGWELTNFHLSFAVSILLRWLAILVVLRIREPKARRATEVLTGHIMPAVVRWLSFPLDFFGREEK